MSHERIEVFGDGGSWIAERLKSFRLTILGQSESLSIVRNPTDNSAWVTHDDTGLVLFHHDSGTVLRWTTPRLATASLSIT